MKLSSKKTKKYSSDEITGNAGLTPGAPRDIMKPKDADVKMEKTPAHGGNRRRNRRADRANTEKNKGLKAALQPLNSPC